MKTRVALAASPAQLTSKKKEFPMLAKRVVAVRICPRCPTLPEEHRIITQNFIGGKKGVRSRVGFDLGWLVLG